MPSGLVAPDGTYASQLAGKSELTITTIDRDDPAQKGPLAHARPWRATAPRATSTAPEPSPIRAPATGRPPDLWPCSVVESGARVT